MAKMFLLFCGLLVFVGSGPTTLPTQGFTQHNLTKANIEIQKPYDKQASQRYNRFVKGVHSMWVYKNDKPYSRESKTKARTEIGIEVSYLDLIHHIPLNSHSMLYVFY